MRSSDNKQMGPNIIAEKYVYQNILNPFRQNAMHGFSITYQVLGTGIDILATLKF